MNIKWKDKWSKEDLILAYYYSCFGTRGLGISEKELAENVLGTSLASLNMQSANFDYLKGFSGLDRPHKIQSEVYDEFKGVNQNILRNKCLEIIGGKGDENKKSYQTKQRQKKLQSDLEAEFRKRGLNPSKMKPVVK